MFSSSHQCMKQDGLTPAAETSTAPFRLSSARTGMVREVNGQMIEVEEPLLADSPATLPALIQQASITIPIPFRLSHGKKTPQVHGLVVDYPRHTDYQGKLVAIKRYPYGSIVDISEPRTLATYLLEHVPGLRRLLVTFDFSRNRTKEDGLTSEQVHAEFEFIIAELMLLRRSVEFSFANVVRSTLRPDPDNQKCIMKCVRKVDKWSPEMQEYEDIFDTWQLGTKVKVVTWIPEGTIVPAHAVWSKSQRKWIGNRLL